MKLKWVNFALALRVMISYYYHDLLCKLFSKFFAQSFTLLSGQWPHLCQGYSYCIDMFRNISVYLPLLWHPQGRELILSLFCIPAFNTVAGAYEVLHKHWGDIEQVEWENCSPSFTYFKTTDPLAQVLPFPIFLVFITWLICRLVFVHM